MHVQDFTVIRISPIVYNDRDILEIWVISHGPQLGTQTHTHTKIRKQLEVMHVLANTRIRTRTPRQHSEESSSALTDNDAIISKRRKRLWQRLAVLTFAGSLCLILNRASCNMLCVEISRRVFFFCCFLPFKEHAYDLSFEQRKTYNAIHAEQCLIAITEWFNALSF